MDGGLAIYGVGGLNVHIFNISSFFFLDHFLLGKLLLAYNCQSMVSVYSNELISINHTMVL